jgi:adenine-specific DNA-methyltransferase
MRKILENETVKNLLADLEKRVENNILEPNNFEFLKKLLSKAESEEEAISICKLGTTYNKTGIIYEKKLELPSDTLKYFKRDNDLSFDNGGIKHEVIIGDNYYGLKNLLVKYRNNIDVIYIDPPYGIDSMGEFAETNYENAINRDNLLSMLYPRLNLAKQLMSEEGVLFCSIDDRNYSYVKNLIDDVFTEKNVSTMIWNKVSDTGSAGQGKMKITYTFRRDHEYIIVAFKNKQYMEFNKPLRIKEYQNEYDNKDNDPRGPWVSSEMCKSEAKSNPNGKNYYEVKTPKGRVITRQWHYSPEELKELDADNRIFWGDGNIIPRFKRFVNEPQPTTPTSVIQNISQTDGNNDLYNIFGCKIFDNPKPVDLIKWLIEIASKKDSIILDFFSGSATTGQATLEVNRNDKGNRKFIMVQLDEDVEDAYNKNPKDEVLKNQMDLLKEMERPYKLSEITVERLRRIMLGKSIGKNIEFDWINNNEKFGDSLEVYNIDNISVYDVNLFNEIDETIYGSKKINNIKEKIDWVTKNFEKIARRLEEDVTGN